MPLPLSPRGRRYGCKRSNLPPPADPDLHFQMSPAHRESLPAMIDLRPKYNAYGIGVYDQQAESSCTANAWAGLAQYLRAVAKRPNAFIPSRNFIYYCERNIEGDPTVDDGAVINTGVTVLKNFGVCPENIWPYTSADVLVQPSAAAFAAAKPHKIVQPQYLDNTNLQALKACLASGLPIVMGLDVYESFESDVVAKTGVVPMPAPGEKLLGGHAGVIVGYMESSQQFIMRNSWGPAWALAGYCFLPYSYVRSAVLCSDFHTAHNFT